MSAHSVSRLQKQYKAHGLSEQLVSLFRREIYRYFKKYGRDLPWRRSPTPYQVLVSEIMLQQTQVDRVVPKYKQWLKTFPTIDALAAAPLHRILAAWSGLGYNRRARFLWQTAQAVVKEYRGIVPRDVENLEKLPGIGPATARSIAAFGFSQPTVFIETNIRSVYLHFFFPRAKKVTDGRLLPIIEKTLDRAHPRRWYSALMDYGSELKSRVPNPSRRSRHHQRQKPFAGSDRQIRGAILKRLIAGPATARQLAALAEPKQKRAGSILSRLVREKLIERRGWRYRISTTS